MPKKGSRAIAGLALVGVAATLPGCILAVGNTQSDADRRLRALEDRMEAAEERLGVAPEAGTRTERLP